MSLVNGHWFEFSSSTSAEMNMEGNGCYTPITISTISGTLANKCASWWRIRHHLTCPHIKPDFREMPFNLFPVTLVAIVTFLYLSVLSITAAYCFNHHWTISKKWTHIITNTTCVSTLAITLTIYNIYQALRWSIYIIHNGLVIVKHEHHWPELSWIVTKST